MTAVLGRPELGALNTIADLEALTAKLAVVADWHDDLKRKLNRAALRFELCGLDAEEQEQLTEEVSAFTSLCHAVADTLKTTGWNGRRAEAARKADNYIGRDGGPSQPDVEPWGPKRRKRTGDHDATDKVRRLATSVAASATKGGSTS